MQLYRWTIYCYEKDLLSEDGTVKELYNGCNVVIYAFNEEEAIDKAKLIVKKNIYRFTQVVEELDHHELQERMIKAMENLNQEPKKPWEK